MHVFLPVAAACGDGAGLLAALRESAASLTERASRRGSVAHVMPAAEYHVSLSRTAMLPHAHIGPFADALKVALRACEGTARAKLGRRLVGLANDTRTRFFAAVEVGRASPTLTLTLHPSLFTLALALTLHTLHPPPSP